MSPATSSLFGNGITAPTVLLKPCPSADQFVPFQRATRWTAKLPALVKSPAAIRSPLDIVARQRRGRSYLPRRYRRLAPFQI